MSDYVIGITGASGSIYGVRLAEELAKRNYSINLVITESGKIIMLEELGIKNFRELKRQYFQDCKDRIKIWDNDDFMAPFMSGTNAPRAVIIAPCSVGKLASIANGISKNLLERSADVALKENIQLILVIRETPLNLIHLENMLKVARAGAQILPAMPAFYHHPKTIDDMVNFIVGRVLNLLRIEHRLFKSWRE